MNIPQQVQDEISSAERIAVLTGAGVSTASGIPDFRSTDATWSYDIPREIAISLPFFQAQPDIFWEIFRDTFHTKRGAEPNAVHRWIADLQGGREWVKVATQNVDNLHALAGSSEVLEVHGNLSSTLCMNPPCRRRYDRDYAHGLGAPRCPECQNPLKPHVVLFGEEIRHSLEAMEAVRSADVLLILGTSLRVAPFNNIPRQARWSNPYQAQIYVGHEPPAENMNFTHVILGDLTEFVASINPEPTTTWKESGAIVSFGA